MSEKNQREITAETIDDCRKMFIVAGRRILEIYLHNTAYHLSSQHSLTLHGAWVGRCSHSCLLVSAPVAGVRKKEK